MIEFNAENWLCYQPKLTALSLKQIIQPKNAHKLIIERMFEYIFQNVWNFRNV